jgi:uncharacterized small protein (DUF1192 family)
MATKAEEKAQRDVIGKLAGRGEATLSRLGELPGGTKALKAYNDLKLKVDDLGKKVRGVDELERRVAKLEREVASLKRAQKPKPAPKSGSSRARSGSGGTGASA